MPSLSSRARAIRIFFSCADEDREFLHQLERHLSGLIRDGRVECFHRYNIAAGVEWREVAKRYLDTADIILLLVSPDFIASDYCYKEEALYAVAQYKGRAAHVIPVIIRAVIEWEKLAFGKLASLPIGGEAVNMWQNKDEALSSIVKGVRDSVEELTSRLRNATQMMDKTVPWNVPHWRNPFFTGREDVLLDLKRTFDARQLRVQAISGLPGVGKTQVATEYAYRHLNEYQAVLWASADSHELLISSFVRFAEILDLPEHGDANQVAAVKAVQQWLQRNSRWLLILDNMEDLSLIQDFIPAVHSGHVLVTTRARMTGSFARYVGLRPMPIDEGALLLLRRAGLLTTREALRDVSETDSVFARAIALTTAGLPLALDQAGAYIEETGRGLSDYVNLYQNYASSLLERRGSSGRDHPDSVSTTFSLSLEKVKASNPVAVELLEFCAFLHPDAIPEEMIIDGASGLSPELRATVTDPLAFDRAIENLLKFSLIQRESGRNILLVHRLVQEVVRSEMANEQRLSYAERVVRVMDSVFPDPAFPNWSLCQRYLPQAQACARLIEQYKVLLPEASALLHRTGVYLSERGLYAEAERVLTQSLDIAQTLFGTEDPHIISILNALANVYYKKGQYELVESTSRRSLALGEQLTGANRAAVGESLNTLARAFHKQGRFTEEEPLLLRSLALRQEVLGPEHADVAISLNSLANFYNGQAKYAQAEALYRQSLALWQQLLGLEHPRVAQSLNNIAVLYSRQNMYAQAEPLAEQALQIYEQAFRAEHPDIPSALDTLAVIYQEQGKYAEAEALYQRLFTIYDQLLDSEHPQLVVCYNHSARLYFLQGRYVDAEAAAQRALTLGEKVLRPNHHRIGTSLNTLADIYKAQQKFREAEEFYQRALAIREQALGLNDVNTAHTLESYADLLQMEGRSAEAEAMQQRAASILNEHPTS